MERKAGDARFDPKLTRRNATWRSPNRSPIGSPAGLGKHYTSLGAFWAAVYVAGIPATFLAVLVYYRIPAAARYLRQLALLRQTVDIAWQRGVEMPEVNTSTLTHANITAAHVDALYFALVRGSAPSKGSDAAEGELDDDDGGEPKKERAAADSPLDDQRQRRLAAVMRWGRKNVHITHYTWSELKDEEDPRRAGAEQACGELFEHFYPARWYYKLFETAVKLVLTSVLLFIAPGSPVQVLAGVLISFGVLIAYVRLLPYSIKPVRRVAYACNLCIFLLLLLAFSIKAGVQVGGSANKGRPPRTGNFAVSDLVGGPFPDLSDSRSGRISGPPRGVGLSI